LSASRLPWANLPADLSSFIRLHLRDVTDAVIDPLPRDLSSSARPLEGHSVRACIRALLAPGLVAVVGIEDFFFGVAVLAPLDAVVVTVQSIFEGRVSRLATGLPWDGMTCSLTSSGSKRGANRSGPVKVSAQMTSTLVSGSTHGM
jgi:hypothetical protein